MTSSGLMRMEMERQLQGRQSQMGLSVNSQNTTNRTQSKKGSTMRNIQRPKSEQSIPSFFPAQPKELSYSHCDSCVKSVIENFIHRADFGMQKYGTNLDRTDLSLLDWIQHSQEELMDGILYLEKIKKELQKGTQELPDTQGLQQQLYSPFTSSEQKDGEDEVWTEVIKREK